MSNDICFIINSKNLYIDEYLVDLNIPIFFICRDEDNSKYAVICENTKDFEYLICKVSNLSLLKMLKNELSLYDFIYYSTLRWFVKSGESIESDVVKELKDLTPDYYPKRNEYLDLTNEKILNYIQRIENEIQKQEIMSSFELLNVVLNTLTKFSLKVNSSNINYKVGGKVVKERILKNLALVGGIYR